MLYFATKCYTKKLINFRFSCVASCLCGGVREIRTPEPLLTVTRFPGVGEMWSHYADAHELYRFSCFSCVILLKLFDAAENKPHPCDVGCFNRRAVVFFFIYRFEDDDAFL